MKQFKNSIIISLLLSIIAVIGVFAAENFSNSIMKLEFEPVSGNTVNIVIQTKTPYSGTINPVKKDANTYVIMLPNIDNHASTPDYSKIGSISSVSVRTMAGTSTSSGYSKITVTTSSPINLIGKNTIFDSQQTSSTDNTSNSYNYDSDTYSNTNYNSYSPPEYERENYQSSQYTNNADERNDNYSSQDNTNNNSDYVNENTETGQAQENNTDINNSENTETFNKTSGGDNEIFLIIMGIILIALCSAYFYTRAKNKLTQISGETLDIDIKDEAEENQAKQKKSDKKSVKNTIKTLDKKYAAPTKMPVVSEYTQPAPQMDTEKSIDDMNIVDLDELFNEQVKNSESNDALEDFLSEFSFDEQEEEIPEEEAEMFDEETYQEIINNNDIKFSKSDVECINKLLNIEINDETIRDISKYAVSNPIKKSKIQNLENMVANLSISQNISFDKDDILALNKLMNVEIDNDFVTDLRTNPERTKEMEKEILETKVERKKPSEIVTLKVSQLLPDLEDVMKHPEKYEEPEPEKIVVNAEDLLKSIENVTFKPFDDGTRDFEILNDLSERPVAELYSEDFISAKEMEKQEKEKNEPVKEEIVITEPEKTVIAEPKIENKFESEKTNISMPTIKPAIQESKTKPVIEKPIINRPKPVAKEPLKQTVKSLEVKPSAQTEQKIVPAKTKPDIKCLLDGNTYDVVSSVALGDNIGCHLAKDSEGYVVLGYFENKLNIIKHYKVLKSEKIQARLSEKLSDGKMRYIIRIGLAKFIADVQDNCISYVMDL